MGRPTCTGQTLMTCQYVATPVSYSTAPGCWLLLYCSTHAQGDGESGVSTHLHRKPWNASQRHGAVRCCRQEGGERRGESLGWVRSGLSEDVRVAN